MTDPNLISENSHAEATELDRWLDEQQAKENDARPAGVDQKTGELAVELAVELLELAATSEPGPAFVEALEQRLLAAAALQSEAHHLSTQSRQPKWRQTMPGKSAATAVAIAILVLAVVAGSQLLGEKASRPATAAELWQRANGALVDEAGDAPFTYDRLRLSWQSSDNDYEDIAGELWQSADGAQWRYQLSDAAGTILYFLQQSDGQVWQSIHPQPVGAVAVTELFVQPAGEPVALPEGALVHHDLAAGWLDLRRLLAERTAACVDLYCLLGFEAAAGSLSGV
jgi:hypothetical protein